MLACTKSGFDVATIPIGGQILLTIATGSASRIGAHFVYCYDVHYSVLGIGRTTGRGATAQEVGCKLQPAIRSELQLAASDPDDWPDRVVVEGPGHESNVTPPLRSHPRPA